MDAFISGLVLNQLFFEEVVRPLLAAQFPSLTYSAALIGYGSDVLGYDTARSTDHAWGPRLTLFLDADAHMRWAQAVDQHLRATLPPTFRGYSTSFTTPDVAGTRERQMVPGEVGRVNHHIEVLTVGAFFREELGVDSAAHLTASDWLTFPEQKLLEVTGGAVFHDGLGQLSALRQQLAYYPHDVWLYRLAAQWRRIAQEEAFVGRCGDVGDDLGSRVVAARLVRELMRLCFLLDRRYAPYSKWLGMAFSRLPCAAGVGPLLSAVLAASDWHERERALADAYEAIARLQNALAVAAPQDPHTRPFYARPYRVLDADRFVAAMTAAIRDPAVRRISDRLGPVGALDQWADSTDVLTRAAMCRQFTSIFTDEG